MFTEENLFLTNVFPCEKVPIDAVSSNERVIRILHFKMTGTCMGDDNIEYNDICTLADHQLLVEVPEFVLLSNRWIYEAYLVGVLTRMKVPIVEQPLIIDKVFTEVERADNPQCAIACLIEDITLFCHTVTMAYRSECFKEVRIDSLEDIERQKQCVICRESLDHVEDIEEGIDRSPLVRLPCSHLYHGDCLSKWLPMSALCPLCRYTLPVVERAVPVVEQAVPVVEQAVPVVEQAVPVVEQAVPVVEQAVPVVEQTVPVVEQTVPVVEQTADEPSWPQLHWPMLLTASAGGVLTAILICRLLK